LEGIDVVDTQTVIEASKVKLRLEIFGDDKLPAGLGQLANSLLGPDWTILPAKAGHYYHVAKRKLNYPGR
jgi:hypothetical protein